MIESCCCPPEAGNTVCDLPAQGFRRPAPAAGVCPHGKPIGKRVQGHTVKALLSVSLREVRAADCLYCRTQTCPIVYCSPDHGQTFTVDHVRERVYQKAPDADDVWVCYCFRHTVGDVGGASPEARAAMLQDIDTGINAGQCACDLRNPQGSCCLGNVRGLIQRMGQPAAETTA